ncbi:bifunctional UDP-N-acetylglucosamine diphosphorylase/glucosamine-1-phosphate N-acetyltransferase GlmU [Natronosporangium hydrolyticum]|uniref:Bifunctional protein GlmU n=1 Tax=Natronosporangium hydrolyticum TaxID=2811111 RepID=A0A895YM96_9ACTN|nr:bifunctional UDP-N-acetylglucosamine diphosphorylase/glucosamine-1-phosphate N-acetyltransferase GlmU [Natronosporangium hydrolyticum]
MVLAAGHGKRMRSTLPKVLHPLLGRTLLGHVLTAAEPLAAERTLVVVGVGADQVSAHLAEVAPKSVPVVQSEQLGTGHAVRTALAALPESELTGTVLVLNGDLPLLRPETLTELVERHEASGAAATLLTAAVPDPTGLGRIRRGPRGDFAGIVEERDASAAQRAIQEINVGCYAFDAAALQTVLGQLSRDNAQREEYLTDAAGILLERGASVAVHQVADPIEALGCNDRAELAAARAQLRDRINREWLRAGVTIIDPATTWLDVTVTLGTDAVIEPHCQLRGATAVGERATVGPESTLTDCLVAEDAVVVRTHAVGAEVGPGAQVGPFSYLRPGARLAARAKVGAFVELKQAELGEGAKVPHLSYVGDATIGPAANIGAGTIFVNYDGVHKHHTEVGVAAFVGSNSSLVAPVSVEDGAYVAAGSVVTLGVEPGALAIARGQQRNVDGWVLRRRPDTASAEAARKAAPPATDQVAGES